jgi:hypothetical protein
MGYFNESTTKKIPLTNPDYWVEILTDLKYGDIKKFTKLNETGEPDIVAQADVFLQTIIKSWNLDDDKGEVLPINADNIDKLDQADAVLLMNEAGGIVQDEDAKKNSTSTPTPA